MDALELINKLSAHPVVEESMSLQVQLGLPWLETRDGKLCIRFLAHREDYRDGHIHFYAPQYDLVWTYPGAHLVFFENRLYRTGPDLSAPVASLSAQRFAERGRYILSELYDRCSRVLELADRDGTVSEVTLRRYQQTFAETVRELGLEAVYGEELP